MKYNNETYKKWIVRMLQEIDGTLFIDKSFDDTEHREALNYTIGFLIGLGWAEQ